MVQFEQKRDMGSHLALVAQSFPNKRCEVAMDRVLLPIYLRHPRYIPTLTLDLLSYTHGQGTTAAPKHRSRCPLPGVAHQAGISLRTACTWFVRNLSSGNTSLAVRRSVRRTPRRTLYPQQLPHAQDPATNVAPSERSPGPRALHLGTGHE